MPRYHIVEDSVAGSRCFIVYEGGKPIHTLWEESLNYDILQAKLGHGIALDQLTDLGAIHDTIRALGGNREMIRGAIEAWLKEKGWLEPRKQS